MNNNTDNTEKDIISQAMTKLAERSNAKQKKKLGKKGYREKFVKMGKISRAKAKAKKQAMGQGVPTKGFVHVLDDFFSLGDK